MIFIIALSLSVMIMLASVYLLGKIRKEDWPKIYSVAAYIGLSLGILFFLGSATAGIARGMCHHKKECVQSCSHGQGYGDMMKCGHSCGHGAHGGQGMMSCGHSCPMHGGGMNTRGGKCRMHKKMNFDNGQANSTIEIEVQKEGEEAAEE